MDLFTDNAVHLSSAEMYFTEYMEISPIIHGCMCESEWCASATVYISIHVNKTLHCDAPNKQVHQEQMATVNEVISHLFGDFSITVDGPLQQI